MIYVKESSAIIYDILKGDPPETWQKLFTKISKNHNYETKMVANDNLYINFSRLELQRRSFFRVGTSIWNSIDLNLRSCSKHVFKFKMRQALLNILTDKNDYVDVPIIKMLPHATVIKFSSYYSLLVISKKIISICVNYSICMFVCLYVFIYAHFIEYHN